ncbi:4-hydroxy-3-methylbut-2-enyl diphosphate reductase [Polluticaenibacter yanchengensis]|uniref:4-hydroxy-3-methylbut-2-enyl diphosphate reductase n=1 Tax=Polluticaenibacter yanchengensis TaxID=3014562 RepID=A0ABT4UFH6_9BACT|nr:4-hydroxy-3-methylbut-2-enyl diphosphate reductase [Chitinophagaceae bacterium LY-5]
MKQFDVPLEYRSSFITDIKNIRKQKDKLKKDFTPTVLDFGVVKFLVARHFGFCYGVENAIEIAYKCIRENPGKRIFLLSEMIHNPHVNKDLMDKGIQFLQDTYGKQLVPYSELTADDIVIIPAFGTTLHVESELEQIGISPKRYNTTCPFVEKVWNRGEALAGKGYSLVVHGKPKHEETRATFSRSAANTPTVIVNDMKDTVELAKYITGEKPYEAFYTEFAGLYSSNFDPEKHLGKLGVINQTTQLATDTQEIADYLKQVIVKHYQLDENHTAEYFADTRDTLCYATNDNQSAVLGMLEEEADLAIVVGGYNSSNTSHLVELCEKKLKTYYISSANEISDEHLIHHFGWRTKERLTTNTFLPDKAVTTIMITSGASCPDAMVEEVIKKILNFKGIELDTEETIKNLQFTT